MNNERTTRIRRIALEAEAQAISHVAVHLVVAAKVAPVDPNEVAEVAEELRQRLVALQNIHLPAYRDTLAPEAIKP